MLDRLNINNKIIFLFLIVIFWKKIDDFILNKLGFKTYKIVGGIIIVALVVLAWLLYD